MAGVDHQDRVRIAVALVREAHEDIADDCDDLVAVVGGDDREQVVCDNCGTVLWDEDGPVQEVEG